MAVWLVQLFITKKDPQNLGYVPVYSITDKDLSKRIQLKENKTLKEKNSELCIRR